MLLLFFSQLGLPGLTQEIPEDCRGGIWAGGICGGQSSGRI